MSGQPTRAAGRPKKVAYLMSRFPKISETFILYEILELERLGLQIEIFPLLRQDEGVMHAEAQALVARARYSRAWSRPVLAAQWHWLRRRPRAYLGSWWAALRGNLGSPKFLLRAMVVVPQAAWMAQEIAAEGVEHIHAHWATHPALAAYVIRRLTERPYSFTAHAHDIYVERPMLAEKIRRASFVVTISEYNRRLLQRLYGQTAADKTLVIHCGIDPTVFQPQAVPASSSTLRIVCVATLEPYKGHPYLIDACALLKQQGIDVRCLLVGEGSERPRLEAQIARLGLGDTVQLLGRQPRQRVRELLAEADLMALPSVTLDNGMQEGIPVALMEAMAIELPVVATSISGIPELVIDGETGLLVPERDASALAGALARLHADPALARRLAEAGRARVLAEFDLFSNAHDLYTILVQDWSEQARVPARGAHSSVASLEG